MHFLIVEDQNMFRNAIRREIEEKYPQAVFSEARTVAELTNIRDPSQFSLAVVDLELADGTSLEWITRVAQQPDAPPILILSSVDAKHEAILYRAAKAGVPGFIHKNDDTSVLHQAIELLLAGGMFYSPTINQMRRSHSRPDFFNKILTEREQEMLAYIGEGLSNEEIAQKMALRHASVLEYRKRLMGKLDKHTATDLMKYAIEKGFTKL